ncbi:MAG: DUF6352 family protein [Alphaproteobacteria bacterium]|nr:DUF6352 family protein [Alphaproteobacteria bacterium]
MAARPDFWISSGYGLTPPNASGQLPVTDDLLRAYLARPELAPVAESCSAERDVHAALIDDPRQTVDDTRLASFEDSDTAYNYGIFLQFRNLLLDAGTLEAAYSRLVRGVDFPVPGLFMDQLVHALIRHILDDNQNPLQARAAELLFRSQRVTIQDGQIMMADEETVDRFATTGGFGDLGRLLKESNTAMREVDLDVLTEENGQMYWARSDRFDTVLDLTFPRPGLDAFCRVLEKWVAYFLSLETRIHPVQSIRDERWVWHTGLDADSSALLNDLYRGEEPEEDRLARLLSLFRMEIKSEDAVIDRVRGRPIYLGLAMDSSGTLRMKPQNLLVNLPISEAA